MKNQLFNSLEKYAPWQKVLAASQKIGVSAIYDATESQRAYLAAALSQQTG